MRLSQYLRGMTAERQTRVWRHRAVLLLSTAALSLGAAAGTGYWLLGDGKQVPRTEQGLTAEQSYALATRDASKARFFGVLHGLRLGTPTALQEAGHSADSESLDCSSDPDADHTPTVLDFELSYRPPQLSSADSASVEKIVCSGRARSVLKTYRLETVYGGGRLSIDRTLWDHRAFPINAAADRVASSQIGGKPSIFVRPLDLNSGYGQSEILILERDVLDPSATLLHIVAENLPWSEVIQIAAGIS